MYKLAMGSFIGAPPTSISIMIGSSIPKADHVVDDSLIGLGRTEGMIVDEDPGITLLRVWRKFQHMRFSSDDRVHFPFTSISAFPERISY